MLEEVGLSGTTTTTEKVSRRFRFCLHHRVPPQFQPPSTRGTTDLNQTATLGFDLNQNSPARFFRRHDNSELPCCYDGVSSSLRQTRTVLHLTTETSRLKIRGCGGFAWGILSVVQVSLRLKNCICRRNHCFADPENWVRDSCHLSNYNECDDESEGEYNNWDYRDNQRYDAPELLFCKNKVPSCTMKMEPRAIRSRMCKYLGYRWFGT